MTPDAVCRLVVGVHEAELQRWIDRAWLRPQWRDNTWYFAEIDVARVRLIVTLQVELEIDPDAVPVVLSLLDQLHDARRGLRLMQEAIAESLPPDQRLRLAESLRRHAAAHDEDHA
jgi:chaperone modulatory protein CbpM